MAKTASIFQKVASLPPLLKNSQFWSKKAVFERNEHKEFYYHFVIVTLREKSRNARF